MIRYNNRSNFSRSGFPFPSNPVITAKRMSRENVIGKKEERVNKTIDLKKMEDAWKDLALVRTTLICRSF